MTRADEHTSFAEEKCTELIDEATQLRKNAWLSHRELCETLGLSSHGNITMIENHKTIPRLDRFLRILSALGYTLKIVPKK